MSDFKSLFKCPGCEGVFFTAIEGGILVCANRIFLEATAIT